MEYYKLLHNITGSFYGQVIKSEIKLSSPSFARAKTFPLIKSSSLTKHFSQLDLDVVRNITSARSLDYKLITVIRPATEV